MKAEHLATIRTVMLGLTGLSCVGYAVLAFWQGRPDPIGWYVPGTIGAASAMLITVAAFVAGNQQARMATDDLYKHVTHRAERQAYWVSMGLFVVVAILCARGVIDWDTGFAVLGTLMGAAFLLLFVWHDLRMR